MSELEKKDEQARAVSRREFLKIAGVAGATIGVAGGLGGLLAACGGTETTTTTTAARRDHHHGGSRPPRPRRPRPRPPRASSAAVEMGREIKIGAVSPITGSLASFGGPGQVDRQLRA